MSKQHEWHGVFLADQDEPVALFRDDHLDYAQQWHRREWGTNAGTVVAKVDVSGVKLSRATKETLEARNEVEGETATDALRDIEKGAIKTELATERRREELTKEAEKELKAENKKK